MRGINKKYKSEFKQRQEDYSHMRGINFHHIRMLRMRL